MWRIARRAGDAAVPVGRSSTYIRRPPFAALDTETRLGTLRRAPVASCSATT